MAVSNLIFRCNNSQRLFHLWFQEAEPTLSYLNYLNKDWYYLKDGEDNEDAEDEDEDAGYPVMKVREVRIVKRSQRSDSL